MISLQRRLNTGLLASLVALFAIQAVVVTTTIGELVRDHLASRLQDDAEGLLGGLSFAPDGGPVLAQSAAGPVYQRPFSGHYFAVTANGGQLRSRSLWDESWAAEPVPVGETAVHTRSGPLGQTLLVVVSGYLKQEQHVTVAVAEDMSSLQEAIRRFQWIYVAVSGSALAGLMLLQAGIVRNGFRSLNRVREDISRLEHGEVSELSEAVPREIHPLVREVNRLLATLDKRLQRSRRAMGDLAHGFKTPMARLRQVSERPELAQFPSLRHELQEQIAILTDKSERELKRARLAGAAKAGGRFPAAAELAPLVQMLQAAYRHKDLQFQLDVANALVLPFDREDMLELLGNLLDNACKWAAHRIRVEITAGESCSLMVEDDGPGIAGHRQDRLLQRGQRGDETIAGHGIGLAIVKDIIDDYNGRMALEHSPALGGLRVQVEIPIGNIPAAAP